MSEISEEKTGISRRNLIQTGAALGAAASIANLNTNYAYAQNNAGRIKVGLVGCGGRGTGAATDSARASKDIQIVALGDVFPERVNGARNGLKGLGDQFAVTDDRCFVGFDAYKKVIDAGVDMVLLATPPGFRPLHLAYAVDKGKHVFMEKPVAVDPVGARSVIASGDIATAKKLAIVSGTQRRHQERYLETIKRIQAGDIGDITTGRIYWNQGGLWMNAREANWSDMEWQLRNWLYFTWLSGDHIVEQHVHNIDVMNWTMGGPPIRVLGLGGRQVRTDPAYGHIYDHFAIEYEFANGVKWSGQCRQMDGTSSRVGEDIVGTKGSGYFGGLKGEKPWRFEGDERNPYEQEHVDLIQSIKDGTPLNEAKRIAESTLTAIMARESAYTGQSLAWSNIMNSELNLAPAPLDTLKMDMKLILPPVPLPGKTKFDRKEFPA